MSIDEIQEAKAKTFKLTKQEQFGGEIESLTDGKEKTKINKIIQFFPFLDKEGFFGAKDRIGKKQFEKKRSIVQKFYFWYIRQNMQLGSSCKTGTKTIKTKALGMQETLYSTKLEPKAYGMPWDQSGTCPLLKKSW